MYQIMKLPALIILEKSFEKRCVTINILTRLLKHINLVVLHLVLEHTAPVKTEQKVLK